VLNAFFVGKTLPISTGTQISIIGKYIMITALSIFLTFFITKEIQLLPIIAIMLKSLLFVIIYIVGNFITKTPGFASVLDKGLIVLRTRGLIKTTV
jgi:hypothetical protein